MRSCLSLLGCLFFALPGFAGGLEDYPARASSVVRADPRTGRLVRAVVAAPVARAGAKTSARVPEAVRKAALDRGLDPLLVHAVIQAESSYNPFAVSPKGAQGLMQLMPATARRYGAANSFNITENLQAGVSYLRDLMDMFGSQELALAAYNAGEGAVIRHRGIPPYPETRQYVRSITSRYATARRTGAGGASTPAEPPAPAYRPIEQRIDAHGNLYVLTR